MAIQVEKKEIITVTDDNGTPLTKGDPILIRCQDQDIVCRYMGDEEWILCNRNIG